MEHFSFRDVVLSPYEDRANDRLLWRIFHSDLHLDTKRTNHAITFDKHRAHIRATLCHSPMDDTAENLDSKVSSAELKEKLEKPRNSGFATEAELSKATKDRIDIEMHEELKRDPLDCSYLASRYWCRYWGRKQNYAGGEGWGFRNKSGPFVLHLTNLFLRCI